MLRIRYFIFFFLIIPALSYSQEPFQFGIYGGFNASQVSGDDLSGFNKFGVYGGLFTGQELNNDWSWELGLVFTQKGSYLGGNSGRNYLLNMNYVEAPVALRKAIKDFNVEAGVSFAALIGYKETAFKSPVNDPREFGKYELAGFIGGLYNINDKLAGMVRFQNSLLPVRMHRSGATYLWNRGQYHTVITVALRYKMSN